MDLLTSIAAFIIMAVITGWAFIAISLIVLIPIFFHIPIYN